MENKSKNIAILIGGHYRTWNKCNSSFLELLNKYNNHNFYIFFNTYDIKYGYHPYIKGILNYFEDEKLTKNDTDELLISHKNIIHKEINIIDTNLLEEKINTNTFHNNMKPYKEGYFQYLNFHTLIDTMKNFETKNKINFDIIIKTRFDLFYKNDKWDIDFNNIKDNELYIDNNNIFPNDHILIGTRNIIVDIPYFILNEYIKPTNNLSWSNPPHGLLENYIITHNIKIILLDLVNILRKIT